MNPIIGSDFFAGEGAVIGGVPMVFREGKPVDVQGGVIIGDRVWIGSRAVIMNGDKGPTRIGDDVIIGAHSTIGHDAIIGDGVRVLLGSHIAGYVEIGEKTLIGMGALIRNRVKIGRGCLIGMGSVVVKDVPAFTVAYGNPARVNLKKSIRKYLLETYRNVVK